MSRAIEPCSRNALRLAAESMALAGFLVFFAAISKLFPELFAALRNRGRKSSHTCGFTRKFHGGICRLPDCALV